MQVHVVIKLEHEKSSVPWRDKGAVRTCTASEEALRVAGLQVNLSRNSELALCGQVP